MSVSTTSSQLALRTSSLTTTEISEIPDETQRVIYIRDGGHAITPADKQVIVKAANYVVVTADELFTIHAAYRPHKSKLVVLPDRLLEDPSLLASVDLVTNATGTKSELFLRAVVAGAKDVIATKNDKSHLVQLGVTSLIALKRVFERGVFELPGTTTSASALRGYLDSVPDVDVKNFKAADAIESDAKWRLGLAIAKDGDPPTGFTVATEFSKIRISNASTRAEVASNEATSMKRKADMAFEELHKKTIGVAAVLDTEFDYSIVLDKEGVDFSNSSSMLLEGGKKMKLSYAKLLASVAQPVCGVGHFAGVVLVGAAHRATQTDTLVVTRT